MENKNKKNNNSSNSLVFGRWLQTKRPQSAILPCDKKYHYSLDIYDFSNGKTCTNLLFNF